MHPPLYLSAAGAPLASIAMAASGAGTAAVSRKKILVVEDNELSMKLVSDLLELHGYAIFKAGRGDEAVRLARESGPDLILLNIQLPDISGLEVARRLKADAEMRPIPIVAVTAYAMEGDEEKARTAGVDGYVTKPIRIQHFLRTVETFVAPAG